MRNKIPFKIKCAKEVPTPKLQRYSNWGILVDNINKGEGIVTLPINIFNKPDCRRDEQTKILMRTLRGYTNILLRLSYIKSVCIVGTTFRIEQYNGVPNITLTNAKKCYMTQYIVDKSKLIKSKKK